MNDSYQYHLLPVHTFMRLEPIGSTLKMAPMNPEWIDDLLEDDPDAIGHERQEDRVVLTASPKELQAFVIKHESTPDAFGELSNLRRREPNVDL
jgi:hypothetical protein